MSTGQATKRIASFVLAMVAYSCPMQAKDVIVSWQETVQIEHQDRTNRLKKLASARLPATPRFYEYKINSAELPPSFRTDIPVLRVVFDQRVFFDTDRDALRPEAEAVIDVVAQALRREASDTAVFISGHTDSRGSAGYNYALSVRRAETVARALDRRGVKQANIWRVGFGKAVPLVSNDTEEGMARNRRVEFVFGRKAEAVTNWLSKQTVCGEADKAQREQCPGRDFAELPRVEALPIRKGEIARSIVGPESTGTVPITPKIDKPDLVSILPVPPRTNVDLPSRTPPTVVTIARDEPVVIDLREKRVYVERLPR